MEKKHHPFSLHPAITQPEASQQSRGGVGWRGVSQPGHRAGQDLDTGEDGEADRKY